MPISASLFIKPDDEKVWALYPERPVNLAGDAGFDLYVPETVTFAPHESRKVSMGVRCMMRLYDDTEQSFCSAVMMYLMQLWYSFVSIIAFPCIVSHWKLTKVNEEEGSVTSFLIYPRSSIANTPLRLSNSVGVVDSGYRGPIMAALDNISDKPFRLEAGTRVVQLCAPGLVPFQTVTRVESFEDTERGSRGFGSTN